MANIISNKYPYISEDENGKWKHYNANFKILIEPSYYYLETNPDFQAEMPIDRVAQLESKLKANTEYTAFLEECLVEMAEIVYA